MVVVKIFLWVLLVGHLGAGGLHHAGHPDGLHLLIVHVLGAAGVDDGLSLDDGLAINGVVIHLLCQLHYGAGNSGVASDNDMRYQLDLH